MNRGGFALITVLVISLVLFSLLTAVLTANYQLRSQNRHWAEDLQLRATAVQTADR